LAEFSGWTGLAGFFLDCSLSQKAKIQISIKTSPIEMKLCPNLYFMVKGSYLQKINSQNSRDKSRFEKRLSKMGVSQISSKVESEMLVGKLVEQSLKMFPKVIAPIDQPKNIPKTSNRRTPQKSQKELEKWCFWRRNLIWYGTRTWYGTVSRDQKQGYNVAKPPNLKHNQK